MLENGQIGLDGGFVAGQELARNAGFEQTEATADGELAEQKGQRAKADTAGSKDQEFEIAGLKNRTKLAGQNTQLHRSKTYAKDEGHDYEGRQPVGEQKHHLGAPRSKHRVRLAGTKRQPAVRSEAIQHKTGVAKTARSIAGSKAQSFEKEKQKRSQARWEKVGLCRMRTAEV